MGSLLVQVLPSGQPWKVPAGTNAVPEFVVSVTNAATGLPVAQLNETNFHAKVWPRLLPKPGEQNQTGVVQLNVAGVVEIHGVIVDTPKGLYSVALEVPVTNPQVGWQLPGHVIALGVTYQHFDSIGSPLVQYQGQGITWKAVNDPDDTGPL